MHQIKFSSFVFRKILTNSNQEAIFFLGKKDIFFIYEIKDNCESNVTTKSRKNDCRSKIVSDITYSRSITCFRVYEITLNFVHQVIVHCAHILIYITLIMSLIKEVKESRLSWLPCGISERTRNLFNFT